MSLRTNPSRSLVAPWRAVTTASARAVAAALAALALLAGTGSALAAPPAALACTLESAAYEVGAAAVVFKVDVACGAGAAAPHAVAYPVGRPLLVGLTLYAGQGVAPGADADGLTQKPNPGARPRVLLRDPDGKSYDFAVQEFVLKPGSGRTSFRFEAPANALAPFRHALFAVWDKKHQHRCDRRDRYARSGCARYGYTLGGEEGPDPVDAYPGMLAGSGADSDGSTQSWLVERFR